MSIEHLIVGRTSKINNNPNFEIKYLRVLNIKWIDITSMTETKSWMPIKFKSQVWTRDGPFKGL